MKKAFTLIELLVVVLIIGILSAIAIPQYQKVVARSRSAEAVLMLSALNQAQQRFQLANGEYTTDLSLLDIEVKNSDSFSYITADTNSEGALGSYWRSNAVSKQYNLFFEVPVTRSTSWCAAGAGETLANSICQTYGTYDHSGFGMKYYRF